MTFFFKTVFRAPQSHELGIGIGLRLGLGLGQGCGARKTKLKKMAISMYLVLDREFISKTELRGSVYRLPGGGCA